LSIRPHTIPALKQWDANTATYRFGSGSRIILHNAQLAETGSVFAEDLRLLSGLVIPVFQDTQSQAGDIVLTLSDANRKQRTQSYYLEITDQVKISAQTDDDVFSGTRTVLQLLKQDFALAGGIAYDWPDYPQRSLMVDVGRQYFSLAWLESHFRDLAYLKYNLFHLHFSDNFGFRLESERHPEIVSQQYYTKAEIQALHDLARKYHITIVPEIDVPGHLDAALASHPELLLANERGQRQTGDLDLALEATYTFVQDLLEEYLPLFSGPYWHLGADEYLLHGGNYSNFPQLEAEAKKRYGNQASGKDLYLGFVNWAHELVKGHGKITRVWSDGLYGGSAVTPTTDSIIYEHWVSWGLTPGEIVARAIPIVNANIRYLYYVPGSERMTANPAALYEQFEPSMFCLEFNELNNIEGVTVPAGSTASPGDLNLLDHHPLNLGAKLHVWCDNPQVETEEQIAAAIEPALRSLSQKNWGSPKLVESYEGFYEIIQAIGHAPGYSIPR